MTILPKAIYRFSAIPIKFPMAFFIELEEKNLKICMTPQKSLNSQSNLKKEKWSWRNQTPWLQTILQSYSNQDNVVLAQKQKYRSVEQDRKPRDKPMHLWSTNLWQRSQGHTMDKRPVSSISGAGKTGQLHVKDKIRTFPNTIHKNKLKMDWTLNVRPDTIKLLEENRGRTLFDINHSKIFFDPSPRVMEIKPNINKWELMKLEGFCTAEETIARRKGSPQNGRKYLQTNQWTKD